MRILSRLQEFLPILSCTNHIEEPEALTNQVARRQLTNQIKNANSPNIINSHKAQQIPSSRSFNTNEQIDDTELGFKLVYSAYEFAPPSLEPGVQPDGFTGLDPQTLAELRPLGKGSCGVVKLASIKEIGTNQEQEVVQKAPIVYQTEDVCIPLGISELEQEAKILKFLTQYNHPNIIKYIGSKELSQQIQDNNITLPCLILEKAKSDLKAHLEEKNRLNEEEMLNLALGLASGLELLAQHKIVHFDLKAENLLIGNDGKLKIADFGLAVYPTPEKDKFLPIGTPMYIPPELREISTPTPFSSKSDIWATGLNFLHLALGNQKFEEFVRDNIEYDNLIGHTQQTLEAKIDEALSDREKNPTLNSFIVVIKKALTIDPNARVSPSELKQMLCDIDNKKTKSGTVSLINKSWFKYLGM